MENFDKAGESRRLGFELRALFDDTTEPALRERLIERMLERERDLSVAAGVVHFTDEDVDRLMELGREEFDAEMDRLGVPAVSKETEESLIAGIEEDLDEHFGPKS